MYPTLPVTAETVAVGLLERLWHLTIVSAKRGDIGKLTDETIAESVGWLDDAVLLIEILVDAKWLDRSDEHRLVIHDWAEHAPTFIKRNIKRMGGFVSSEEATKHTSESLSGDLTAQKHLQVPTPNLTKPNLTKPNQTERGGARTKMQQPTIEQCLEFGKTIELSPADCEAMFDHYEANGWKVGSNPMRNWQAAMRKWKGNCGKYNNGRTSTPTHTASSQAARNRRAEKAVGECPEDNAPTARRL